MSALGMKLLPLYVAIHLVIIATVHQGFTHAAAAAAEVNDETTTTTCEAVEGTNVLWFNFSVDYFASEVGAYAVNECGTSPTLKMRRGVEYTFVQKEISNWMHPLGFAYYPDGAHGFEGHAEVPELEHPTPAECDDELFACNPGTGKQAPLYRIDASCETYADWNNGETSGLDVYERAFKIPQEQWAEKGGAGMYSVKLTIPTDSKSAELFYFCHIHRGMSGRIVVVDDDNYDITQPQPGSKVLPASEKRLLNSLKIPFVPELYYPVVDAFDRSCGTFGVHDYSGEGMAVYYYSRTH